MKNKFMRLVKITYEVYRGADLKKMGARTAILFFICLNLHKNYFIM